VLLVTPYVFGDQSQGLVRGQRFALGFHILQSGLRPRIRHAHCLTGIHDRAAVAGDG